MKKIISTSFFLLFIELTFCQKVKFGVKSGINLSTTSDYSSVGSSQSGYIANSSNNNSYVYRPNLGIFLNVKLSEKLSFQPELLYSLQGAKIKYTNKSIELDNSPSYVSDKTISYLNATVKFKLTTSYLNLPLLVQYRISKKMNLIAGPQIGILLSGNLKTDVYEEKYVYITDYDSNKDIEKHVWKSNSKTPQTVKLNPITIGICAGTNYALTEKLFLEARYFYSFSNDYTKKDAYSIPDSKTSVLQASIGYIF